VDGKIRLLDQIYYRSQPSLIWYRERAIYTKPQLCEPDNIGEVEPFECLVVGNIEKDGLDSVRSMHAISLRKTGRMRGLRRISSVQGT